MVRTPGFHPGNRGSIPLRATKAAFYQKAAFFYALYFQSTSYDLAPLNKKRLVLLNSQSQTQLKSTGVLGLDDKMLIHYGKSFNEIVLLFDHATNAYVWTHNLLNLHYSDGQTDYPTLFELWNPIDIDQVEKGLVLQ